MATITAGDFRNGKTFEMDGKIMQVVEFQHVKPGKGAAFVRTKMKNVVTSFNPTAKFEEAFIERKDYEYSYNDGDLYYFMDQETYDMVPVSKDMLDDSFKFIKENTPVKLLSYKGNVFSVETPNFVELTVTKADPGVKGDTATNVTKPATVETGAEIKVPLFINEAKKVISNMVGEFDVTVHQRGRKDPDRHPHGRISGPSQGLIQTSAKGKPPERRFYDDAF